MGQSHKRSGRFSPGWWSLFRHPWSHGLRKIKSSFEQYELSVRKRVDEKLERLSQYPIIDREIWEEMTERMIEEETKKCKRCNQDPFPGCQDGAVPSDPRHQGMQNWVICPNLKEHESPAVSEDEIENNSKSN